MIKLLILVGIFNSHPTYIKEKVPRDIIQATYKVTPDWRGFNCYVALNKKFGRDAVLFTKETCQEVQEKLRKSHESH